MNARAGIDLTAGRLLGLRQAARDADFASRSANRAGALAGRRRGMGLEIRDLRGFSEGDDLRHVDAAATARTGEPHVRTYHEEEDDTALLVADFRGSMFWGSVRCLRSFAAAEALAIAGWRVAEAGGSVGLVTLSETGIDFLRPRAGEAAMPGIAAALEKAHAEALATVSMARKLTLDAALERVGRIARRGSSIILATGLDDPGEDLRNVLDRLRPKVRAVLLEVRDAVETAPHARELPFADADGAVRWGRLTNVHGAARQTFADSGARILQIHAGREDLFAGDAT